MVQAVLNATARSSLTVAEFARAFSGRIGLLARTHALIIEGPRPAASFDGLLRAELDPYDERGRLALDGPQVVLPSELAVPVGMALHELTTNALWQRLAGRPERPPPGNLVGRGGGLRPLLALGLGRARRPAPHPTR